MAIDLGTDLTKVAVVRPGIPMEIVLDSGKEFTVETLLAMFLEYIKKTAEAFADSQMKTAVITVPSYFTQAERRAVLRSAGLANIEVIQLIDDNVAVALDYIRPRVKLAEEKPVYLFFDVGATATTATLVSYQMAQVKGESSGEHPHIFVLGAASDTALGTNAFIDRLQAHLIKRFKAVHNLDVDISKNARAVAKFRREASRVFKILSANKEIQASVNFAPFRFKKANAYAFEVFIGRVC
ncbi:unnamed protein product [Hydatigera taeniaeformis]|uniref:Hypoxia up-regulated protein 1 n=1 Tax=Hydatigena taeniaeformis TaxID=6205 RepID=A0A0R3WS71_HYDTA|nr:unnamed protein product [Hydatigera taeniaeformis]